VYKKRTESAFYHPESKPETRVGITNANPESLVNTGFSGFNFYLEYTKGTR